jgi:hypothetical protein
MTGFFLNVLLLLFAFVGGLTAIGGKTWVDAEKLLRRVTPRGWLALTCMFLALSVGIVKELRAKRSAALADTQLAESQARMEGISAALTDARKERNDASQARAAAEKKLAHTLESMKPTTESLKKQLQEAKDQLTKMREAQQLSEERYYGVASFSRPDQEIAEAYDLDYNEPLALFGGEVVAFNNDFRGFIGLITKNPKTGERKEYPMPPGAHEIKIEGVPGEPLQVAIAKPASGFGTGSLVLRITSADPMRHERRKKSFEWVDRIEGK